ncbi:MAG: FAD-dependent oxidoreductase [Pseudomonadota bacterium]
MRRTIVVGAGIMGAWTARRLAQDGHAVTVLEAKRAPCSGVTAHSFGWINSINSRPGSRDHTDRRAALALWRAWSHPSTQRSGALVWADRPAETRALCAARRAAGDAVRLCDPPEIAALAPALAAPPLAMLAHDDLAVDTAMACAALLDGVETRFGVRVRAVLDRAGRTVGVATDAGPILADTVVLATGPNLPDLPGPGSRPTLPISPAVMVRARLAQPRRLLNTILNGPDIEIRQTSDLSLRLSRAADPALDEAGHAAAAADAIARYFPGAGPLTKIAARIVERPYPPADPGLPGLFLAIAHPGVILAPLIAQRIAKRLAAKKTKETVA